MHVNTKQRRRHSAAFKTEVLAACAEPGASIAAVALAFKLNDNLVHQWRRGRGAPKAHGLGFIGVAEAAPRFRVARSDGSTADGCFVGKTSQPTSEMITLDFKRGTLGVTVTWPVSAAADCAAWLREVLR